jgi:hypothetical protein
MQQDEGGQRQNHQPSARTKARLGFEAVVPNPKLKLMDQVREVLRLKH